MPILQVIDALSKLFDVVRNVMIDVRSRQDSQIDRDLLRLKAREIANALDEFREQIKRDIEEQKAIKLQELATRGLANTTILDSMYRAIEQDNYDRVERAERHVQQSHEEIALLMRRCKR